MRFVPTILLLVATGFMVSLRFAQTPLQMSLFQTMWGGVRDDMLDVGMYLLLAALLSRVLIGLISLFWSRRRHHMPALVGQLTTLIVFIITILLICSQLFGMKVGGLFATSGVASIVLAFALRSLILDVFSGIALNFDKSFRLGDWLVITHGGLPPLTARVDQIQWRTVRLMDRAANLIILPNSILATAVIANQSQPEPWSEDMVSVRIDFSIPPERARQLLENAGLAAANHPGIRRDPPPDMRVWTIDERRTEYRLHFMVNPALLSLTRGRSVVQTAILEQLHGAGIAPALAQQMVWHDSMANIDADQRFHAGFVASLALFRGLTPAQVARLTEGVQQHSFLPNQVIVEQGAAGNSLFIVCEGLVAVRLHDSKSGTVEFARLGPRNVFGEMSYLTGAPRSAEIMAVTATTCLELFPDALGMLIDESPELIDFLSNTAAERQLANDAAMANLDAAAQQARRRSIANQIADQIRNTFRRKP